MAISDYLTNVYTRFTTFSRTTTFRFVAAITASSILTSISLLSFQSFQRRTHRKALRDSVEGRLALKEEERQRRLGGGVDGRPSISRTTTIDDKDEELIDYSDTAKAQQQRRDRINGYSTPLIDTVDVNEPRVYDEEIIKEQLARNIAFLGEEAVDKIRNSFVIVVGIGGVGSAAGKQPLDTTCSRLHKV
jgi:hypothetical protein